MLPEEAVNLATLLMSVESTHANISLVDHAHVPARRLPKLRVCFAHGGGAFPGTVGRIQHGFDARPDLCAADCPTPPMQQLGRFWADSLVHDAAALNGIVELFGEFTV